MLVRQGPQEAKKLQTTATKMELHACLLAQVSLAPKALTLSQLLVSPVSHMDQSISDQSVKIVPGLEMPPVGPCLHQTLSASRLVAMLEEMQQSHAEVA